MLILHIQNMTARADKFTYQLPAEIDASVKKMHRKYQCHVAAEHAKKQGNHVITFLKTKKMDDSKNNG